MEVAVSKVLVTYFLCMVNFGLSASPELKCELCHYAPVHHRNWDILNHDVCGQSTSTLKIFGGLEATAGQFPWMARLGHKKNSGSNVYFCGGSLINKYYVLTAGHCVTDPPPNTVRLGANNVRKGARPCKGKYCPNLPQDINVERVLLHPQYDSNKLKNDIALVRLTRPAVFNEWVIPICLPHGPMLHRDYVGSTVEVAGWGYYNSEQIQSQKLLYVQLPVLSLKECRRTFTHEDISEGQLCAGGQRGKDSCNGDSGGPLMRMDATYGIQRYYQLGIVSYGFSDCGRENTPAVYTNVIFYLRWILDNIKS